MKHSIGTMFGWTMLCLALSGSAFAEDARQAIVKSIQGEVGVRIGQADWKPAEVGAVMHVGDEIRTGKASTAEILLDKEGSTAQLDLKPESRMQFSTLDWNPETKENKKTILDLAVGSVLIHAEKVHENSDFQVRTPNSITGVRGTTFLVSAEVAQEED